LIDMSGTGGGGGGGAATDAGGVGGNTFGTLSSIGSDLSVSVSFNIARELLNAASDEQISEDELIGLVLGFAVVFTALQSAIGSSLKRRKEREVAKAKESVRKLYPNDARRIHDILESWSQQHKGSVNKVPYIAPPLCNDPLSLSQYKQAGMQSAAALMLALEDAAGREAIDRLSEKRSIYDFVFLIVSICQRISVAIAVQLLAASVRTQQPSRLVRTISLIGLAAFFVFVESLTHRGLL
jgi:hypothetical protein